MNILDLPHPSSRLYNGEIGTFVEAMHVYQCQMRHENRITEHLALVDKKPITANERNLMTRLEILAKKAAEAVEIYWKHMKAAEQAIEAELRAKDDQNFTAFADALATGDYHDLAI